MTSSTSDGTPNRDISDFFRKEYCQYGSYDLYRKIGSVVDGLKMSSRKVIHTLIANNIRTPKKVFTLQSKVIEDTNYLHGDASLYGVIVGLAQDFVGTNNIPLLQRGGTFGTRLIPAAAAGRYISTALAPVADKVFRKEDLAILVSQEFEGDAIEPRFFVPTVPLILVNGSEGLSTGFCQKILPRDPREVIQYIRTRLSGKTPGVKLLPHYRGFNGTIKAGDGPTSFVISGSLEVVNANTVRITELPVGYNLASYIKVLDKLEEDKTIHSYTDRSDETFDFEVKVPRSLTKKSRKQLMRMFKLTKNVSEVLNCNDEDNTIIEFDDARGILEKYITVKLGFMDRRKDYMVSTLENDIIVMTSRYEFIKNVVGKKIVLNNRSAASVEKDLDGYELIVRVDDSYDYLLRMPLSSITKERYQKLKAQLKELKSQLNELKKKTPEQMWLDDLTELEASMKSEGL